MSSAGRCVFPWTVHAHIRLGTGPDSRVGIHTPDAINENRNRSRFPRVHSLVHGVDRTAVVAGSVEESLKGVAEPTLDPMNRVSAVSECGYFLAHDSRREARSPRNSLHAAYATVVM